MTQSSKRRPTKAEKTGLQIAYSTRPSTAFRRVLVALGVMLAFSTVTTFAHAQSPDARIGKAELETATSQPIKIGTKIAAPFVIKSEDGKWSGISIDLWQRISLDLNRKFEIQEFETADDVIKAAQTGTIDVGISALSVTSEREQVVDFSHPYYQSGLGIAVAASGGSDWVNLFRALSSGPFLATVGMLALLLFATGAVMWLIERRQNPDHFPEDVVKGVGSGFWWSAVTMTTVGYGDKAPVTFVGRAIAVVWMFAALILTAVFTAQLTSALTLENFSGPVRSVSDLGKADVGILRSASSEEFFRNRRQYAQNFETVKAGLDAVKSGRIDAFVHDKPILSFDIANGFDGDVKLLSDLFETQNYAAVLQQGSPLREQLNQALLDVTSSEVWPAIQAKYLAEGGVE